MDVVPLKLTNDLLTTTSILTTAFVCVVIMKCMGYDVIHVMN